MNTTNYGIMEALKYECPGELAGSRGAATKGLVSMQSHDTPNRKLSIDTDRYRSGRRRKPAPPIRIHESGEFAEVPLTNREGRFVKVDIDDIELVSGIRWYAAGRQDNFYAVSADLRLDRMHRMIMGFPEEQVDHVNGDRFDNRKSNLRICDPQGNAVNRHRLRSDKTSQYRGVSRLRDKNQLWSAQITIDNKMTRIGGYMCEEEAARAYDRAAIEAFGEFALTNFPKSQYIGLHGDGTGEQG